MFVWVRDVTITVGALYLFLYLSLFLRSEKIRAWGGVLKSFNPHSRNKVVTVASVLTQLSEKVWHVHCEQIKRCITFYSHMTRSCIFLRFCSRQKHLRTFLKWLGCCFMMCKTAELRPNVLTSPGYWLYIFAIETFIGQPHTPDEAGEKPVFAWMIVWLTNIYTVW